MDTSDWITAGIAVISLIISISHAILDFQRNKRKIKLNFARNDYPNYRHISTPFFIRIVNSSYRPVEIIEAGFLSNKGETYFPRNWNKDTLPERLNDGDSVEIVFAIGLSNFLVDLSSSEFSLETPDRSIGPFTHAFVRDAEGKMYWKKFTRDLIKFISEKKKSGFNS